VGEGELQVRPAPQGRLYLRVQAWALVAASWSRDGAGPTREAVAVGVDGSVDPVGDFCPFSPIRHRQDDPAEIGRGVARIGKDSAREMHWNPRSEFSIYPCANGTNSAHLSRHSRPRHTENC
jgi:hypothetical protein